MTIGYPAIAKRVISVAAHVGSASWELDDGTTVDAAIDFGEDINAPGQRAGFSSKGPARNQATAGHVPDVMAAGHYVIAALSSEAEDADLDFLVTGDPGEGTAMVAEAGTSMASPVVAGAVALLLQANPQLTPEQVRDVLTKTAWADELGAVPNTDVGFGRLDAKAALAMVETEYPAGSGGGGGGGADAGGTGGGADAGGTGGSTDTAGGNGSTDAAGGGAPIAGGGGGGGGGCTAATTDRTAGSSAGILAAVMLLLVALRWRRNAKLGATTVVALLATGLVAGGCGGAKAASNKDPTPADGPAADPTDGPAAKFSGEVRRAIADAGDGDVALLLKLGEGAPGDAASIRTALDAAGCSAKTVAGDIVTASCAASRASEWGGLAWVVSAEPGRRARGR
jgi:hypothetical protein